MFEGIACLVKACERSPTLYIYMYIIAQLTRL